LASSRTIEPLAAQTMQKKNFNHFSRKKGEKKERNLLGFDLVDIKVISEAGALETKKKKSFLVLVEKEKKGGKVEGKGVPVKPRKVSSWLMLRGKGSWQFSIST